MDSTSSATVEPLLAFELLADHSGRPAALLLHLDPPSGAHLPGALSTPEFQRIRTDLPCLYIDPGESGLSPEMAAALARSGFEPTSSLEVHRAREADFSAVSVHARWIGGNWFLNPPAKADPRTGASRASTLHLLQLVSADAPTRDIETVFKREPALSYHLLRLVNSVGVGTGRRITSLSQAIMILGRQQLRRWLNLLLFAAREDDPRTQMLLARAVCHARLLELLAQETGYDKAAQDQAFMTGLFSLLGILFGLPLEDVIEPLSVSEGVRAALLRHEGELGRHLDLADAALHGDLNRIAAELRRNALSSTSFNILQIQAISWMRDVLRPGGA
ncbi:MAG: HDOD domain-containing protein [Rhodocyclaceae bacterium]|nr:HDOD domain-containing protein [Rhodocyclaceae bacterium]MCL4760112.1 HDOD domain-containing protein [Rhodocyclaceae bacterium]